MSTSNLTLALDADEDSKLQSLARKWEVSATEAMRRLLREAQDTREILSPEEKIRVLHALQRRLKERGVDFEKWQATIRDGRR